MFLRRRSRVCDFPSWFNLKSIALVTMCSSQFKVPLVHCNVTSVNPSSDFLLVQSICSCIQLQIPAWDLEGILGMNLLITDLPVSTEWPEITQRSCRNVSRVMLFSYHDCCLELWSVCMLSTQANICVYISGGPLSALTCCVNVRLLSAIKKISPLIYSQSWVGSWVYTTQAMMTFTLIF